MTGLIITSTEKYSGKSTLVVGIAKALQDRGLKVGYLKPIGSYPIKVEGHRVDEDAYFMKEALGLSDSFADISPYVLTWDVQNRYMKKKPGDTAKKVAGCYKRISQGKDVVLVEGPQNFIHGKSLGISSLELSRILSAGVVIIDSYSDDLTVDRAVASRDYFGEYFLGMILNWVLEWRKEFVEENLQKFFTSENIKLFGWMNINRLLRSISVNDLATGLNGEIICARDKGDELIESMMIGAMGQEQCLNLFRKQSNKVVITGGDRSDILLAALETSTKALILTGGHRPSPLVLGQAEEMGVPMITVKYDTATTVDMVEAAIGHQRFHSEKKIGIISKLVEEKLDLDLMLKDAEKLNDKLGAVG